MQNIADPGYRCLPVITINGTDADPVYPGPGNGADVALGRPNRVSASRSFKCLPQFGCTQFQP